MNSQNKYAQVTFDFEANYADELFAKSGDVVQIEYDIDQDWVYAKLLVENENGRAGMIPLNYLKMIEIPDYVDNKLYVAGSDFKMIESGDLEFKEGDLLVATEKIDENWSYGYKLYNSNRQGVFPMTHVIKIALEANNKNIKLNNDQLNYNLRQAKAICDFDNEMYLNDSSNQYLKFNKEDYILVIKKMDDSWLYGENMNGDKGLFPINHVQIIMDRENNDSPILNRTQRRFTIVQEAINDQHDQKPVQDSNEILKTPKYCQVLYDFPPEGNKELGCFSGEYLKINSKFNDEWIHCANFYNKQGLVPVNFVTFLQQDDDLTHELFTNQTKSKTNISPSNIDQNTSNKNEYERSSSSNQLSSLNNTNGFIRAKSLTPITANEIKNSFKKNNKPPIPPKPKIPNISIRAPINPVPIVNETLIETIDNNLIKDSNDHVLKRKYIITELIDTERNYYNELKACYDVFMSQDMISFNTSTISTTPNDFDKNFLFDNLKPVIDCSKTLLDYIDIELTKTENIIENINIAKCLINSIENMKIHHAKYARNHNTVANLVKKYELNAITNEYIKERINCIKDKLTIYSLSALLIKPVQRIFKYPLFINRLLENTDPNEENYSDLKNSLKHCTEMLEFINEYKRRKDLINKYLTNTEQNDTKIAEMMKKLNIKSIKKKSNRLRMEISSILGIMNKHITDESFDKIESIYRIVEKATRTFHSSLELYLINFREVLDCEKNIFSVLSIIFEDDFKTFSKFESSANTIRSVKYQNYANIIMRKISKPLSTIISCFNGPNKLIDKRHDKLLDYESALSDLEFKTSSQYPIASTSFKDIEANLEKSKKDYEAMNYQLIEELPILILNTVKILMASFEYFAKLNRNFIQMIQKNLDENMDVTCIDLSVVSQENHLTQQAFVMSKLTNINTKLNRQSIPSYQQDLNRSSSQINLIKNEEKRQILLSKYPIDKLYIVSQIYVANEKQCQLNQKINDLVGLIKPCDPSNQSHNWYVDNGETEGFIPSDALMPYNQHISNINLIDLNEKKEKRESNVDLLKELSFYDDQMEIPQYCTALFNFKAIASNMINLTCGEVYKVIEKFDKKGNKDWWLVETNRLERGYVPIVDF